MEFNHLHPLAFEDAHRDPDHFYYYFYYFFITFLLLKLMEVARIELGLRTKDKNTTGLFGYEL